MLNYVILGIIQGITEFLPISSSGHLVIMQKILGITGQEVALSVVLHLGTLFAVAIFFLKDILGLCRDKKMLLFIFVVTIITGIIGVLGKGFFESLFSSVKSVAVALLFTGAILLFTKRFTQAKRDSLGIKDALILGFTQAIAIIPGISRSGITISTLLFRGIDREMSFKFSFLVSIPIILGATLLEVKNIGFALNGNFNGFLVGFIFSLSSGMVSLWLLRQILRKAKFYFFGYYCIIIGIITLLFI